MLLFMTTNLRIPAESTCDLEAKRRYKDAMIVLSWDFNHWPGEEVLKEHVDMDEVQHGPTRGKRKIDRNFTNFGEAITGAHMLEPLECEAGSVNDHRVVYVEAETEKSKTITYS